MATEHRVKASSFADPADIRAFRRCKERGGSDSYCFKFGDNGIGCWGDDCSEGSGPSCALPPEVMEYYWGSVSEAKHKKILVSRGEGQVVCTIKDRMPHLENIHNGARIDLNPDAVRALGWEPPLMDYVVWKKIEDV